MCFLLETRFKGAFEEVELTLLNILHENQIDGEADVYVKVFLYGLNLRTKTKNEAYSDRNDLISRDQISLTKIKNLHGI